MTKALLSKEGKGPTQINFIENQVNIVSARVRVPLRVVSIAHVSELDVDETTGFRSKILLR